MRHTHQWLEWLEGRIWSAGDETRGFKAGVKRYLQIVDSSSRGYRAHDSMTKASALTYTSILTLVPLLAIVLSLLKGFNMFQSAQRAIVKVATDMLNAAGAEQAAKDAIGEIIDRVFEIVKTTDFSRLGLVATVGLLLAAMSLMSRVEMVMNDVWSVHKSRPLARKIADYINMLLVLALMLVAMSGAASKTLFTFGGRWSQLNVLQGWLLYFTPYISRGWPHFPVHYMPNTRVRWRSAIVSGLVSGILFQMLQWRFFRDGGAHDRPLPHDLRLVRHRAVPAFLDLVFVVDRAVGVEFCNAHQNIRDWRRRRRSWFNTPAERETLALRWRPCGPADARHGQRGAADGHGELADTLNLPSEPVGEVLDLFENNGW